MKTNAPEFLANFAAALYEEDPIYFDVMEMWRDMFRRALDISTPLGYGTEVSIEYDRKCVRAKWFLEMKI